MTALQALWVVPVLGLLVPLAAAGGAGALALHVARARRQQGSGHRSRRDGSREKEVAELPIPAYPA